MTDERDPLPEPAELDAVRERSRRARGTENVRRLRTRLNPIDQPKEDGK